MSWVIGHSPHGGSELLCLLMVANHAHADGTGAYPSVATLAAECRMSARQVTRLLHRLQDSGALR
jgi:AraC-like DNA-binding protein